MQKFKTGLIDLLIHKSFQYSNEATFKLVSGRMSKFYINCKPTTLSSLGMILTGNLVFKEICDKEIRAVGGLTFGADPIAMATAYTSGIHRRPVNAFSIRKTQKDHGVIKWVEGEVVQGWKVAIVDDVVTTGGSTIKAIERAQAEGLVVAQVVIVVDRQEDNGMENVRDKVPGIPVSSIVTREELMNAYQSIVERC